MIESPRKRNIFVIRAHHLPSFKELLLLSQGRSLSDAVTMKIANLKQKFSQEEDCGHILDVLGETEESQDLHWRNREELLMKFLTASDESLVVVTDGKDDICNICAVGKHCESFLNSIADGLAFRELAIKYKTSLTLGELKEKLLES